MLQPTLNELRLEFELTLNSPLCVGSAEGAFPRGAHPNGGQPSLYIPASTLKGALRRAAESVFEAVGVTCCSAAEPCAQRESVKQAKGAVGIYRALCPICRLFGSHVLRSHLIVTDCFPAEPRQTTVKHQGVDVLMDGEFYGMLGLRNFERWQLGLLALLVSRLNVSDVQLGAQRSSGMGCVQLSYGRLTLVYPGVDPARYAELQRNVQGIGQFVPPANPYRFTKPDSGAIPDLPPTTRLETDFGFAAVAIADFDDDVEDDTDPDTDANPAATPGDPTLSNAHNLIDSVLTQQALAWGAFVRDLKRELKLT